MLYQRTPLAGRHEYFLDCALEADEINAFAHAALTLLGDRQRIGAIVDVEPPVERLRPLRDRWEICDRLDEYAQQLVSDLPLPEQRAFAAIGLLREPLKLFALAQFLAAFNFEDETRGGAARPFRRWWRCDDDYNPTPRARRRLYAPAAIRRYAKLEVQSVPRARTLAKGLRRLPTSEPAEAELITALLAEQRAQHREAYLAEKRTFEAEQRRRYGALMATPGHITGIMHGHRRSVKRAARFAAGVVGARQVGAFSRGDAVMLRGAAVNIEVTRRRSIASAGHGAVDVRLLDPNGVGLANLCVYFEKTPALDQLAALALHVQAGEETAVIDAGNLFNVTADGANHPLIAERLAAKTVPDFAGAPGPRGGPWHRPTDHELKWIAQETYTNRTIGIYYDAVEVQVWGRDARRLEPFKKALEVKGRKVEERLR